jgi:predicted DCC family thiol-disulfide oxidoreductase YuxK
MDEDRTTTRLTILYDERCEICRRCRDWLLTQPCFIEVELVPAGSIEAKERFGDLTWAGKELIAIDETGRMWIGPSAFLASLWATRRYRAWSYRLSSPAMASFAEDFFRWVSRRRDRWGAWLTREDADCSWCDQARVTAGW